MPKPPTNPSLFDNVLKLGISNLKKLGYLEPKIIKSGFINWISNGEKCASISIKVDFNDNYIELDYKANGDPVKYKVKLVSIPSNIGKGFIWYFLCPVTHKRCRNLYLIGNRFLHREAFSNSMYKCQTHSKKWRNMEKIYGVYFDYDEIYGKLHKKHFKSTYNGKPTKSFLKLNAQYQRYEALDHEDIERLLVCGI